MEIFALAPGDTKKTEAEEKEEREVEEESKEQREAARNDKDEHKIICNRIKRILDRQGTQGKRGLTNRGSVAAASGAGAVKDKLSSGVVAVVVVVVTVASLAFIF